jgi:hypothetical protein
MTSSLVQILYDKLTEQEIFELRDYYAVRAMDALSKFVQMGFSTNHKYFRIEKSSDDITVVVYSSVKIWGDELSILMDLMKDESFKMSWVDYDSNMQMVMVVFTSTIKRMLEREVNLGKNSHFPFVREVIKP